MTLIKSEYGGGASRGAWQAPKPKDPKLVGGIYFNPDPLSVINKEHEGPNSISLFKNFFAGTKAKDEGVVKQDGAAKK